MLYDENGTFNFDLKSYKWTFKLFLKITIDENIP